MKKLLKRLVLLGALAGAVYTVRNYLRSEPTAGGSAQLVFDDGSTRSLTTDTTQGNELIDTAKKLVELGL